MPLSLHLFQGYRSRKEFIVTQMPLAKTVVDFWRLVDDFGISTIVALSPQEVGVDSSENTEVGCQLCHVYKNCYGMSVVVLIVHRSPVMTQSVFSTMRAHVAAQSKTGSTRTLAGVARVVSCLD